MAKMVRNGKPSNQNDEKTVGSRHPMITDDNDTNGTGLGSTWKSKKKKKII